MADADPLGPVNLALHGWREPIERLSAIAEAEGWPLWLPTPGVPSEVRAGEAARSGWWRRAARPEVGAASLRADLG